MWIEWNIITVENQEDWQPSLAINQEELDLAIENSNDKDWVNALIDNLLASIGTQADNYLDISFRDDGEFNAEREDMVNAMKEIATKLSNDLKWFKNDEIKSTTDLKTRLVGYNGKKITDILDLYRSPVAHEKMQQVLVKATSAEDSYSNSEYGRIWSKRVDQ